MVSIHQTFLELNKQYDEAIESVTRPYLVLSPKAELSYRSYSNCFSIAFDQWKGCSFSMQELLPVLGNRAENFLKEIRLNSTTDKIAALKTLIKTCLIASHVLGKKVQIVVLPQAMKLLSEIANKPLVQVALEFDAPEIAYAFIKSGNTFFGINELRLQKLVPLCLLEKNHELLLQLLSLGVVVSKDEVDFGLLAILALDRHNEQALLSLLNQGLDCRFQDKNKVPFALRVASCGMIDAISWMMNKGVPLHEVDTQDNGILHYGLLSAHVPMCKMLMQKVDPCSKNKKNQTPLEYYLLTNTSMQIGKSQFIQELLEGSENCFFGNFNKNNDFCVGDVQLDQLGLDLPELLFLLGRKLPKKFCSREDLSASCKEMKKRYPEKNVQEFETSHFAVDKGHYKYGTQECRPGPSPEGVQVNELLTLFNGLNLDRPDEEGYQDPEGVLKAVGVSSVKELGDYLKKFITTANSRTAFLGTPRSGSDALKVFFDQIELHLKHVVKALKISKDPRAILAVIQELAMASHKCGGRYYSVSVEQYLRVCLGREETPLSKIYKSLAEFRAICLQSAVTMSSADVHNYNHALRAIGKKYGIPGSDQAGLFDDHYIGGNYNIEQIEKEFLKLYTPTSLTCEWILPLLKSDGDFRAFYIDFHKEHIPDWFEKSKYDEIKEKIRSLKKEEIVEFFDENDIFWDPKQTAEQAIEEERRALYLEQVVYNNNELTLDGVLSCLEELGAIIPGIKWKSSVKEIRPIHVNENALYRQVTGIFQSILSFFGF